MATASTSSPARGSTSSATRPPRSTIPSSCSTGRSAAASTSSSSATTTPPTTRSSPRHPSRRAAADRHDALFILNDRPDLVAAAKADGVHVGQDDTPVAAARAAAGEDAIVGLSSHRPEQLAAALAADGPSRPDYISIGPVWATPTKPGRPAAGLDYVRHAAAHAGDLPWFAIGGIDATNIGEVAAAGASRVVVVRALRDVSDPQGAARGLLAALSSPAGAAAP